MGKKISFEIPLDLWRELSIAKIDGKIESIASAVLAGLRIVLAEAKKEGKK